MSTRIRTNQIECDINRESLNQKYDLMYLETSEKYIKGGSYVLDASVMCDDIKAIKFESGRKVLLLMNKDTANKEKLKALFMQLEDGDKYSIKKISFDEIEDSILVQLLLNALGTYDSEFLKCNNLTGHLYCFHPNWIKHGKEKNEDVIWKVPCLEISVNKDMVVNLFVRTFTSERLKKKITFKKRKFEEYPKYIFAANNTLRRRLKDDNESGYILRQVDGVKTEITFLDIQNKDKFDQSKIGILNSVIELFNEKYEGICKLNFHDEETTKRIDYSKATQRESSCRIKEILDETKIHIVDLINDEYSSIYCRNIQELLNAKYNVDSSIGKRISKDKLNILLIHNAEYYGGVNDPHDKNYGEVAVQHITFEDFSDSSEFAISTVIHELVIKQDIMNKKISLFDWKELNFKETVSFGIEQEINDEKRYFFMHINPDGTFEIREQEYTLFEMDEYTELVDIFENARTNTENVKGIIRFDDGRINIIKDSGLMTLPKMEIIDNLLSNGDNKLRGKERREELLASCLDIKMYEKNGKVYYFVGSIGEGMRPTIQRAAIIRSVEGDEGTNVDFDRMLKLMNVTFVRNGQLTVAPFPFKYLREYVKNI